MTLINTTISDNSAGIAGGGIYSLSGNPTLYNTLVAGNFGPPEGDTRPDDVYGAFDVASSYNLIGAIDGSTGLDGTGALYGTVASLLDPVIGTLENNGGPTETHALLIDDLAISPAIDAGNNALFGNFGGIQTSLAGAIDATQLSLIVDDATFFPGTVPFQVRIDAEDMLTISSCSKRSAAIRTCPLR